MRRSLPEPVLDERALVNFGPVIDPPFADARPGAVTAVFDEVREVASEPWDPPLTAELAARALAVALASPELIREVADTRYEVIGVGLAGGKRERPWPIAILYRYQDDTVLEFALDPDATTVVRVDAYHDQPMLTEAEVVRARQIAARELCLQEAGVDPDSGMGLVVAELDPSHARYRHRLADLRYAPPDHRNPQAFAIVDLSTEELVYSGVYDRAELS